MTKVNNVVKGVSQGIKQTGKGLLNFYFGGMMVASRIWPLGPGAKGSFSNLILRSTARMAISFIPNEILNTLFGS